MEREKSKMILKISFILVLLSSAFIFDLQAKELFKRRLEIQKLKERAEVAEKTWYNCAKWLAGDKDAENPKKIRR